MIEELLRAAVDDAGLPEHTAVLLLVPGYREGATEYAYFPPGGGPMRVSNTTSSTTPSRASTTSAASTASWPMPTPTLR